MLPNYKTVLNSDDYKVTNLERIKVELNNRLYYQDDKLAMYLAENNLDPEDTYEKSTMQKKLLYTVYDILESLSNNIEVFRTVEEETGTTGEAYSKLEKRLDSLRKRIASISDLPQEDGGNSDVSFMFYTYKE